MTDTGGFLIGLIVHKANLQNRDGAPFVLKSILRSHPWLRHIFGDAGYGGQKLKGATDMIGRLVIDIVRQIPETTGIDVLWRRWVSALGANLRPAPSLFRAKTAVGTNLPIYLHQIGRRRVTLNRSQWW